MLMSLGEQDTQVAPQVDSYSPSGISAFAEILKRQGFPIVVDQQPTYRANPNDVVINFVRKNSDDILMATQDAEDHFQTFFWSSIAKGATGIVVPLDLDYLKASQTASRNQPDTVKDTLTGEVFKVSRSRPADVEMDEPDGPATSVSFTIWTSKDQPFLKAHRVNNGTALVVRDGIGMTNRFIDHHDNARAFVSIVSMYLKPGGRVIFAEASFGNIHERGLLETIGPWANAAWQQLLFFGVVVVLTLGIRFGYAEESRRKQRGARELLEGLSDTFRRAKATDLALGTAWKRADSDLRLMLKLPKDASRAERDRHLPPSLQTALGRLEASMSMEQVSPDQALELIKRSQIEMDAFVGSHRLRLRRLAKLKT